MKAAKEVLRWWSNGGFQPPYRKGNHRIFWGGGDPFLVAASEVSRCWRLEPEEIKALARLPEFRRAVARQRYFHAPAWPDLPQFVVDSGHYLGLKSLCLVGDTGDEPVLFSPVYPASWEQGKVWASEYDESSQALYAPGIHAWGFQEAAAHACEDSWWAVVAALGHVTVGDVSWRAKGAAIVRLWAPVNGPSAAFLSKKSRQLGVPVSAAPFPAHAAAIWVWQHVRQRRSVFGEEE